MPNPLVVIVGRPNVGKSTLFNRLTGRGDAIVTDVAGTTRDRLLAQVSWEDIQFTLVDTGGLEPRPQDLLRDQVKAQVEAAVHEADLIIFLLDVMDGLTPVDHEIAEWLRRTEKPVVAVVNKVDNQRREASTAEFYELGMSDPLVISAYHNLGIYDLMDRVTSLLPPTTPEEETAEGVMKLAIVGRTNVGKSMLLNSILGQDRAIVADAPGTTRDALDTRFEYDGQPLVLIDTAGIRRPGKVARGIEFYSVLRSVRAVERCDIALLGDGRLGAGHCPGRPYNRPGLEQSQGTDRGGEQVGPGPEGRWHRAGSGNSGGAAAAPFHALRAHMLYRRPRGRGHR